MEKKKKKKKDLALTHVAKLSWPFPVCTLRLRAYICRVMLVLYST